MALSDAQKWANAFSDQVNPQPSFVDRFVKDMSDTAKGFVPGLLEIGKTVGHDLATPFTGNSFRSDNLVKGMAGGFKQQSFIPSLLSGHFGEAASRFSAKPFSGLLDASMVFPAASTAGRIGRSVGTEASRTSWAKFGGYVPIVGSSADALRGSLTNLGAEGPSVFDRLPATLQTDSVLVPTREFFSGSSPQSMMIGDTPLLRRRSRTMLPGGTDKFESELAAQHRNQLNLPVDKTLGEDPLRQQVRPRADDELIAKMGDKAEDWFDQRFPGFASRRLARKIQRRNMTRGRVSGDVALGAAGRADDEMNPVLEELAPDMSPEERRQALGDALLAASINGGDVDEIMRGIERWNPETTPLAETIDPELLDLHPTEYGLKTGTMPFRQDENGGILDPFDHDDAGLTVRELIDKYGETFAEQYSARRLSPAQMEQLNNYSTARADVIRRAREALEDQDYSAGFIDWKYADENNAPRRLTREDLDANPNLAFQAIERNLGAPRGNVENLQMLDQSGGLTDLARERIQAARNALSTLQSGRGTRKDIAALETPLVQQLMKVYEEAEQGKVALARPHAYIRRAMDRLEKGEDLTIDDLAPTGWRKNLDPGFRREQEPAFQRYNALAAKVRQAFQYGTGRDRFDELVEQVGSTDPAAIEKVLSEQHGQSFNELVDAWRAMRDSRAMFDSTSRYTRGQLSTADFMRGKNVSVANEAPGVYSRMMEALSDASPRAGLVKALLADERFEPYRRYKQAITNKTGEISKEILGGNRLPEESIEQKRRRLAQWTLGTEGDLGEFFPMKYQRVERPEAEEVDSVMGDLRKTADREEPGNPFEVFLSGRFDTSPDVHVRNYLRQNDKLTHDRIIDNIYDSALVKTPKELSDPKMRGTYIHEKDVGKNNSKSAAPWVVLNPDGPLIKDIKSARASIESMAYTLRENGKHDAADALEGFMDDIEGVDPTIQRADRSVRAAASDQETKAPKELKHHLIPTPMYSALKKEVENSIASVNLAADAMKKAGGYWKFSVLHARFPSWFRNNFVGAQIMLAMSGGLSEMGTAYSKILGDTPESQLLQEYIPEAAELGSSHIARGIRSMQLTDEAGPMANNFFKAMDWLSDVNQKYADSPARLARTQQVFDQKVKELQQLSSQHGIELEDTMELRQKMLQHGPTRDAIAEEMLRDMVDFSNMGRLEREWITALLPFYSWMKGSSQAAQRMLSDHPERVLAAKEIADVGARETTADAGQAAPDFARGWYNLGGDAWMKTGGWNPYETPIDLFSMGLGLVPGGMSYNQYGTENLLGNTHPFLSGGMAAILGRDPFFGTPIENDNPADTFLRRQLDNPVLDFMGVFKDGTGPTSTTNKTPAMNLMNILGLGLVDPRWDAVHARGYDEAMERFRNPGTVQALNPLAAGISPR